MTTVLCVVCVVTANLTVLCVVCVVTANLNGKSTDLIAGQH